MKIEYTRKLYFKKFHYKITVQTEGAAKTWWYVPDSVKTIQRWCDNNLDTTSAKVTKRVQSYDSQQQTSVYHVCIYCKDDAVRDQVLAQYGGQVVMIHQPLDDLHKHKLDVRNVIEVRKTLIYNRFRHAVYFKYDRKGQIHEWLQDYFKDHARVRVTGNRWWTKVYLEDDTEIAVLQLSWSEMIDYIKTVRCIHESV